MWVLLFILKLLPFSFFLLLKLSQLFLFSRLSDFLRLELVEVGGKFLLTVFLSGVFLNEFLVSEVTDRSTLINEYSFY